MTCTLRHLPSPTRLARLVLLLAVAAPAAWILRPVAAQDPPLVMLAPKAQPGGSGGTGLTKLWYLLENWLKRAVLGVQEYTVLTV